VVAGAAAMDAAFVALFLELRFSFRRPIGAVGPHLVAGVGLVQDLIKLLAVVNGRVGLGIAPNDLVLAVDTDVVLVAVEAFLTLLRPASILVFLRILGWLLIPPLGRFAALIASFSPRVLCCLGALTMVASTICPPRAM